MQAIAENTIDGNTTAITDARTFLESYLMAFAAEESRYNNTVINMNQFRQQAKNDL